jgi:aryl-alcohol dehydrogenase-like predicted oxidoreductase
MEVISLGESGLKVSRLAMGCWTIGGHGWGGVHNEESILAVQYAFDSGVTFFDTADVYGFGHSEKVLRKALGEHRKDVIIASKFGVRWDRDGRTWKDISPRYMRQALEASLRRLRLECIPLYYVHWPDGRTPVTDIMGELARCRDEGKILAIGVSNFSVAQLEEAINVADVHAVQVQFNVIDRGRATEVLPLCLLYGIPLVTWGSLADGLLTGKFDEHTRFTKYDHRRRNLNFQGKYLLQNLKLVNLLRTMAEKRNGTIAQFALRWLLDTPGVGSVIFGARRPEQVKENIGSLGWTLTTNEYKMVEALSTSCK